VEHETAFHNLMHSLWLYMDIALPPNARSDVYSVTFAKEIEVHFLSTQRGYLDIISEAGILVNKEASHALLQLLALNYPPLTVSIDQDSGSVLVWTRQELAALDREQLVSLITHLLKSVYLAKECVDGRVQQRFMKPPLEHRELFRLSEGQTLGRLKLRN
jgi:hypothetical protein